LAAERLGKPRYMVHWKSRMMTRDRQVHDVLVNQIASGGVALISQQAQPIGADVNIEFHVKYRGNMERFRAKTKVAYCRILSDNQGAVLELLFTYASKEEIHMFNNILQVFANAKEFQLRT